MKPKHLRIAGLAAAALAVMMLSYRIYLAIVTTRLARSGASEEALFALTIDPLWRLELAAARAMGDAGSIHFMNALAISCWVLVSAIAVWLGIRVWNWQEPNHVTPIP